MEFTSTCQGIRSRLREDFRKMSKLDISFSGGADERSKIRDFNRYLEESKAIPNNVSLDFNFSGLCDLGVVFTKLFEEHGGDLETLTLRLRDVMDFERLSDLWEFATNLTELNLDFESCMYDSEPTTSNTFDYYYKGLYLHNLRELSLPFDSFDHLPVKTFLYQADLTNLVHLSSPDGSTQLDTSMLKKVKRYTGIQFELKNEIGMTRYIKSANQDEFFDLDIKTSDDESGSSDSQISDDDSIESADEESDLSDNVPIDDDN